MELPMMNKLVKRLGWLSLGICLLHAVPVSAGENLRYNRDIRPILAENCFACHGPDKNARKAGLRLDVRDEAIEKGAITPGNPHKSELIERILSEEKSQRMPPPKTQKTLTAAQKDLLRRWIADGAQYQPHWAFIPPQRPALPKVKNAGWVRNPIDNFILAELEKIGLQPAPEADRRTLARRLSLDLTGLPPAPEEVDAFLQDTSPDAYERYVDRLMKSPHWGEHRGRYWLDAARYADTHGIHIDNYREIWSYRDWVIRAFNNNMPFDRFTMEQLAGDLLPNRTLDQQIASGFNRCNITTNEGGAIAEEYLVYYTRDRTETTSRVWLGLTANCAVCHDHKFDPLSQREFYQMSAFFNNTTQQAMDGNIKDTPPVVMVPQPQDRPHWESVTRQLAEVRKTIAAHKVAARPDFDRWLAKAKREQVAAMLPVAALCLHVPLDEGDGKTIHFVADGKNRAVTLASGLVWEPGYVAAKCVKTKPGGAVEIADAGDFDRNQSFAFGAWVRVPRTNFAGSVFARMDDQHDFRGWDLWFENGRVASHIIHKWPEDAVKVVTRDPVRGGQWNHLFVSYDGSGKASGVRIYVNGVQQATEVAADNLRNTTRTQVPLKLAQRHSTSRIDNINIEDVRVYNRALAPAEVEQLARASRAVWLLTKPASNRSAKETDELFDWWEATLDPNAMTTLAKLHALEQEQSLLKSRGSVAYVMQERTQEPMAYVLYRGEYDKRRDPVKPGTPHILPPMPASLPHNRLGFARWLLEPEQPLPARVTVNRFWQEVFGTGIVKTSEDFGTTGELPSNQDLLDWLAVEFRDSGWDVKRFFKMLVTSATYRQAAVATPEKIEKDPQNRLLSRGPRFRMDGEMIRDYALAASGLLVGKIGGPSVKPYQPEGVWEAVAMLESDTRFYRRDAGPNLYRRSMYTFWKRAAPPASMDIFNAPSRETCTVRRERTDTPLQALVTLNDPQFVEAARHLAELALHASGQQNSAGIDVMARRLLARPFAADEMRVVLGSLDGLLRYYREHTDDAKKLVHVGESLPDAKIDIGVLAAWTMLANELMNLDEVLNK
jgi:hypothetical protein